jgi:hypothetical protein
MRVCGRIEDPRLRADPLLAAMRQFQAADQTALLPALGRIGGAAARKTIEAAIAAADPATHETGIVAICHWPDASIAPRIMELAQSDEHAACRTRALRALIRIAPLPDERSDGERLALLQEAMAMCTRDEERILALARARAIRTIETLRFVAPYMDQAAYAEAACETIVELAHHRGLREPHKAEFDAALDKVRETSKDPVVLERADRYKKGQTWARPTAGRE